MLDFEVHLKDRTSKALIKRSRYNSRLRSRALSGVVHRHAKRGYSNHTTTITDNELFHSHTVSYYVDIRLGTPGKCLKGKLDTRSSDLWVLHLLVRTAKKIVLKAYMRKNLNHKVLENMNYFKKEPRKKLKKKMIKLTQRVKNFRAPPPRLVRKSMIQLSVITMD